MKYLSRVEILRLRCNSWACVVKLPRRMAAWVHFSLRWRLIKIDFAKAVPKTGRPVCIARGERAIWQGRFWQHLIRDDNDFRRHVAYCYINPVKHGLVTRIRDWRYSLIRPGSGFQRAAAAAHQYLITLIVDFGVGFGWHPKSSGCRGPCR